MRTTIILCVCHRRHSLFVLTCIEISQSSNEIPQLPKQMEQINRTDTEAEKLAQVYEETTHRLKDRVVGALEAAGETAIDEFILENKYLKVVKAAVKGWFKPGF